MLPGFHAHGAAVDYGLTVATIFAQRFVEPDGELDQQLGR